MPLDSALPAIDIDADFWSLRFVDEATDSYVVRKNVALPFATSLDSGAMATVYVNGGYGYAATSDTSAGGLRRALARARMGGGHRQACDRRFARAAAPSAPRQLRIAGGRLGDADAPRMVRPAARRIALGG